MVNKCLMLIVVVLLSFAYLAVATAQLVLSLMPRGALSLEKRNVFLFQVEMRLTDAQKSLDGTFREISSFMRAR
jgi:hypothetical protein